MRALSLFLVLLIGPAAEAGVAVEIDNASQPTACAETDNVYVKFLGAGIAHFTVEARHPAYLTPAVNDDMAADFANCDQSHDPSYHFAPLDVTLYEDRDYKLVGHRFGTFWRPESVDFRVGPQVTHGLHLVQLMRKFAGRDIEILVVYPGDGYWRLKPLPPPDRVETGYGSSFLVGPIREDGRPYVAIKSIAFDRATLTFHAAFRGGGSGALHVTEVSRQRTQVAVTVPPLSENTPFAALRSMYVAPDNADTANVSFDTDAGSPAFAPILRFQTTKAASATFGRTLPSRHNTSAPDLEFSGFMR